MDCPLAGPIPADPGAAGEGLYLKAIDGAYGFASRCLMDLVVREVGQANGKRFAFFANPGVSHLLQCSVARLPVQQYREDSLP